MDYREFEAQIENGVITVPEHLHAHEHTRVRVTLIEEAVESQFERLQRILSQAKKRNSTTVSTEPDVLVWQKEIRDEW